MVKQPSPANTEFSPSGLLLYASLEEVRLAFRAPLNRRRALKQNPEKVLEKLLDERVSIDGKTKTKREIIIGRLIELAGGKDVAAAALLEKFLARQRGLRMEEWMAEHRVNKDVLWHVAEKVYGK
jgi:hypothetical protein